MLVLFEFWDTVSCKCNVDDIESMWRGNSEIQLSRWRTFAWFTCTLHFPKIINNRQSIPITFTTWLPCILVRSQHGSAFDSQRPKLEEETIMNGICQEPTKRRITFSRRAETTFVITFFMYSTDKIFNFLRAYYSQIMGPNHYYPFSPLVLYC